MLHLDPAAHALHRKNPQSTAELQRLQEKLAFYEQPITTFDRPVENDPAELVDAQRCTIATSTNKQGKRDAKGEEQPCLLVGFARRTVAAMRKMLSTRCAARGDLDSWRTEADKRPVVLKALRGRDHNDQRARPAAPRAHRRFQEMDESTRFRLELAGIRVQSTPHSYMVSV